MAEILDRIAVVIDANDDDYTRAMRNAAASARQAAMQIEQAFAGLSASMARVGPQLTRPVATFAGEMERAETRIRRSTGSISGGIRGMATQMAAFAAITATIGAGGSLISTTGGFEEIFALIQAESGIAGTELERLRNQATRLGASTAASATEVATMQRELAKLGRTAAEIENLTPALTNFSIASGLQPEAAAEFAGALTNQFRIPASGMTEAMDIITAAANASAADIDEFVYSFKYVGPLAEAAGYDLRQTAAALALMSNAGIDASMAGTSLRSILNDSLAPTMRGAAAMERLGFVTKTTTGEVLPLVDLLRQAEERGLTVGDLFRLGFEVDSANAITAMRGIREQLDGLFTRIDNSAGETDRVATARMAGVTGAIRELSGAWETLQLKMEAARFLSDFIGWMGDGVRATTTFVDSIKDLHFAMSASPEFDWLDWLIEKMRELWRLTTDVVGKIATLVGRGVRTLFPQTAEMFDSARSRRADEERAQRDQAPPPLGAPPPRARRSAMPVVPQMMMAGVLPSRQRAQDLANLREQAAAVEQNRGGLARLQQVQEMLNAARQAGEPITRAAAEAHIAETEALQKRIAAATQERVEMAKAVDMRGRLLEIERDLAVSQERAAAAANGPRALRRWEIGQDLIAQGLKLPAEQADALAARMEESERRQERALDRMRSWQSAFQSIGDSVASAFEQAILEGGKLSDTLRSLAKDIAALVLRQTVTNPIASAITSALGGMFGGGKAVGGNVWPGRVYEVGEMGRELFMPRTPGTIVSNAQTGQMGGAPSITYAPQYSFSGTSEEIAQLRRIVANDRAMFEAKVRGIVGDQRSRGRF